MIRKAIRNIAVYACLPLAATVSAQTLVDGPPPPELVAELKAATAASVAGETGPYKAMMLSDQCLPTHTL